MPLEQPFRGLYNLLPLFLIAALPVCLFLWAKRAGRTDYFRVGKYMLAGSFIGPFIIVGLATSKGGAEAASMLGVMLFIACFPAGLFLLLIGYLMRKPPEAAPGGPPAQPPVKPPALESSAGPEQPPPPAAPPR